MRNSNKPLCCINFVCTESGQKGMWFIDKSANNYEQMSMNKVEQKVYFPSLNGLRAISILLVVFYHLEMNYHVFRETFPRKLKSVYGLLSDGHLGVNVFFVISGFLITSLLLSEEKKTGTVSFKNFYIRRTLRIFPAYYFYLLVLFILFSLNIIHISNPSWLTAITYTKYFNWRLDWLTRHAWSLSVEEHFYLFFPLLFTLGNNIRKKLTFILVLLPPIAGIYNHFVPTDWLNDLTIFKRIDALAIGCFIAFYKDALLLLLRKYFKVLFYASFLILFILPFLPYISDKFHLHLGMVLVALGSRHGTIANLCIGIILLYSISTNKGVWFRLLNTKVMNYIGLLSYSIYLWQQLFISDLHYWATSFPQNVVLVFVFAMFSYYFIEKPFLKLKDRFSAPTSKD